jgi:hypothetical protein
MKRLLITLSAIGCFLFADAPDVAGNWKLSGLKVEYLHVARETVSVNLEDSYGVGVVVPVSSVPAGALFQQFTNGPFTLEVIDANQLNLNVNLFPDGTGYIAEGSFYPDIDLIPGTCITSPQIFPVTDEFVYELADEGSAFASTNILGMAGVNDLAGSAGWGFGVAESGTFDGWPSTALPERIPAGLSGVGTPEATLAAGCDAWCFGSDGTDGAAAAAFGGDVATCIGTCATWDYATASAYGASSGLVPGWLQGSGSSGYIALNQGQSQMCAGYDADGNCTGNQDLNVDFLLEWNAVDGETSQSGIDLDDEDGDGDTSEINRIFGIPYIPATFVNDTNPLCDISGGALTGAGAGLAYPVAGDIVAELGGEAAVGALVTGSCMGGVVGGAYDNCIGQVYAGVMAQCDDAGGPVNAVTGLCYEASQGADFAAACGAYGAEAAVSATCSQLGFSDEVCADAGAQGVGGVEAYCDSLDGEYNGTTCADMGLNQCDILVNAEFSLGLCGTLAASLTTSETCTEWVDSFYDYDEDDNIIGESFFDANAASVIGASCTDFSAGLAAGFAAGDATTLATIDGLFASATAGLAGPDGMTCSEYGASYVGMCIEGVDNANDMYLMDPSLETWGLFLTYNAASVQQYLGAGYSMEAIATSFPELFVNDSGYDFDPSCYATGETCGGRLVMNFAPTCVPEFEARQIVAEFVNLDDLCEASGDANGDGTTNVVDIVRIVDHILGGDQLGGYLGCEADINGDNIINVVDVVAIVGQILGRTVENDATEATIQLDNNQISIKADGYVAGVDLVVEYTGDLNIEFADNYVADYSIDGNTAHIILVSTDNVEDVLTVKSGRIVSILEATVVNSNDALPMDNVSIEEPATFVVGEAFPNPFNPSTNISVELTATADLSVKVYNLMGQLVDVIAEGSYSPSTYNWTWNAENLASGVYLVKTQVGSDVSTQKVMLLK